MKLFETLINNHDDHYTLIKHVIVKYTSQNPHNHQHLDCLELKKIISHILKRGIMTDRRDKNFGHIWHEQYFRKTSFHSHSMNQSITKSHCSTKS